MKLKGSLLVNEVKPKNIALKNSEQCRFVFLKKSMSRPQRWMKTLWINCRPKKTVSLI